MMLKTLQWNIGGGQVRAAEADPLAIDSYTHDGIVGIVDTILKYGPDVVTLQETHTREGENQAEIIADACGMAFWVNDEYADSHLNGAYRLGQAVLSRLQLNDHNFVLFTNPGLEADLGHGSIVKCHDKGVTTCTIAVDDLPIRVNTLHAIPFKTFDAPPGSSKAAPVLADMDSKLTNGSARWIVQGDFNIDDPSLHTYFPDALAQPTEEVQQDTVTTPKGKHLDHVVYRGLTLISSMVDDSVLTDHFPIISEFTIH